MKSPCDIDHGYDTYFYGMVPDILSSSIYIDFYSVIPNILSSSVWLQYHIDLYSIIPGILSSSIELVNLHDNL
jgi:hypothetical protein